MTLIEILIAMLVLGLASGGIVGAFVFSRQVNIRSQTRLQMAACGQRIADELRSRVNTPSLEWGIHYDPTIDYDPSTLVRDPPSNAILAYANLCPAAPLRPVTDIICTDVPANFRPRWVYYVEDSIIDVDPATGLPLPHRTELPCAGPGSNPRGRDMDGNPATTELIWTKIQLDWDTVQQ